MPANICYLLICNKAVKALQDGGEYEKFISIPDTDGRKPYLNLQKSLGESLTIEDWLSDFTESHG